MKNLDKELSFEYIRAAGPGGQNVNKVATAVQLRFDVINSTSIGSGLKARLIQLAGRRINAEGVLVIEARRFRAQEANREDAIRRFYALVASASQKIKLRRKTTPTRASKEKRLKKKKERGEIKKNRQKNKQIFEY